MLVKGFFLVLVLLGLFFAAFGIQFLAQAWGAGGWPEVSGEILSVAIRTELETSPGRTVTRGARERARRYYPEVTYAWQVDGVRYTGSRYRLGSTHAKYEEREAAQSAAAKFRAGAPIAVFHDPKRPSEAVLERLPSGGVWVPLPLGLLMAGLGALGLRHSTAIRAAVARGDAAPLELP